MQMFNKMCDLMMKKGEIFLLVSHTKTLLETFISTVKSSTLVRFTNP